MALTAQMQQIEEKNKKLQLKLKQKLLDAQNSGKKKTNSNKKVKKNDDKWAWKDVPPSKGEKHEKTFESKTYYWCPYHKKWTLHKPEECRLKDKQEESKEKETKESMAAVYDDGAFMDL